MDGRPRGRAEGGSGARAKQGRGLEPGHIRAGQGMAGKHSVVDHERAGAGTGAKTGEGHGKGKGRGREGAEAGPGTAAEAKTREGTGTGQSMAWHGMT